MLVPSRPGVDWLHIESVIVELFARAVLPGDDELEDRHGRDIVVRCREFDSRGRGRKVYRRHGKMSPQPLKNARELAKYLCKADDLVALAMRDNDEFKKYVEDVQACRSFSMFGHLAAFKRDIENAGFRAALDSDSAVCMIPKERVHDSGLDEKRHVKSRMTLLMIAFLVSMICQRKKLLI